MITDSERKAREALAEYEAVPVGEWRMQIGAGHVRALVDALDAKDAELAELRLTLLNERGQGEPPSPGWAWEADFTSPGCGAWVDHSWCGWACPIDGGGWEWGSGGGDPDGETPTAREAMRDATAHWAKAGK